jgi:Protein of unknown function (DUF2510)
MTTIEKLYDGLASQLRRSGVPDKADALLEEAPAPQGSPLSVEGPETGTGSAGWYPDPTERHDLRFFDGKQWTDQRTRTLPLEPARRPAHVGS